MQKTQVWSLGQEDPLKKEMATHSCLLAWEIPWSEEPGGLQSTGSKKSRTQLRDSAHTQGLSGQNVCGREADGDSQKIQSGFPWWLSGKESACQCRRPGFHLWSERIPHATEQLILCTCTTTMGPVLQSLGTTTTEPMCLSEACNLQPVLCT